MYLKKIHLYTYNSVIKLTNDKKSNPPSKKKTKHFQLNVRLRVNYIIVITRWVTINFSLQEATRTETR